MSDLHINRRERVFNAMKEAQEKITRAFESLDKIGKFQSHTWKRTVNGDEVSETPSEVTETPSSDMSGGGTAMVLSDGAVFEKAGINVSAVTGARVPDSLAAQHPQAKDKPYFATGLSMVVHTKNPYTPAFHANYRYFEVGEENSAEDSKENIWWFGGGADLTPNYVSEDDVRYFHKTLKKQCDRHRVADYYTLKRACDEYFYLPHRGEMRGVGGIFFDELSPVGKGNWEEDFAFVQDGLQTIVTCYLPLVDLYKNKRYSQQQRQWQLHRRGRYVEFNLVYDRGTLFGLQTKGNIEAILMSMPPVAKWTFDYVPEPRTPEAKMLELLQPRDWF